MAVTINADTSNGLVMTPDTSGEIKLQSAGTDTVTVDTNSNVGIGTSSPANRLHVNSSGSDLVAKFESTDAAAYISLKDSSTSNDLHGIGANGDNLALYSNNAERMRIDSNGRVGIGTSSPSQEFHVVGDIYATGRLLSDPDYSADVSISSWSANTYYNVIPVNTLSNNAVYWVDAKWDHASSGPPYIVASAFLIRTVQVNNTGTSDYQFVPFTSTHTGQGTHYFTFQSQPATGISNGANGLRAKATFTGNGNLKIRAYRMT